MCPGLTPFFLRFGDPSHGLRGRGWSWAGGIGAGMTIFLVCVLGGVPMGAAEISHLEQSSRIQRFHALCRDTGDSPPIRVVVYGQSITAQPWSMATLRRHAAGFPGRQWVIENRSIGGVTASYLERLAESEVFSFNPDLVVFHAYGDVLAYGRLLMALRSRTTAEVMVMNNHFALWDEGGFPERGRWDMIDLPALALASEAAVVDVRTRWRDHLLSRGLPIGALLSDTVHPNLEGQQVLAAALSEQLASPVARPVLDPYRGGRVRRLNREPGGADATARAWRVMFHGNRVVARVPAGARARVRIDGLAPSETVRGRIHGRTQGWPGSGWPFHLRVQTRMPLVDEIWTLRITEVIGPRRVRFEVRGSRTGPDGDGVSSEGFVSDSGRVVLNEGDWYWENLFTDLAVGTEFRWSTIPQGVDEVSGAGTVSWVDVVSNLELGEHVLELEDLTPLGGPRIEQLILHDPSGKEVMDHGVVQQMSSGEGMLIRGSGPVETSVDLREWRDWNEGMAVAGGKWWRVSEEGTGTRFFRVRDEGSAGSVSR